MAPRKPRIHRGTPKAEGVPTARKAIELREDRHFGALAMARLQDWDGRLLTHEAVWARKPATRAGRRGAR